VTRAYISKSVRTEKLSTRLHGWQDDKANWTKQNMMTKKLSIFSGALLLLAGFTCVHAQATDPSEPEVAGSGQVSQLTLDDLRTFTDVFNQARRNYVEDVDDKTLLDAAIRGMLLELDPHSSYLPAKEFEELNDAAQGRYSGIGIDVQPQDGKITVQAIINDSPADQAGMNPGDIITAIGGKPIKGRFLPDAMDELLGPPDTTVDLIVLSPEGESRELTITRRYVKVPTLSFRLLEGSNGYFKITQFHRESAIHLQESLESIKNDGIELNALVIDLRENPGGILQQAVAMADGFLDSGMIVSTRGRNSTMQLAFRAQPGQWLPADTPIMLLVDRGTASASEVLAGALQDNGRALIAGERTFGKGSVQSVLPLRNGAGIKLTTARYYTPSGRSIQAEGIKPDVVIEWNEMTEISDSGGREADLEGHLGKEMTIPDGGSLPAGISLDGFPLEELLQVLKDEGLING
jgi:carboxyl-terminal processing protease